MVRPRQLLRRGHHHRDPQWLSLRDRPHRRDDLLLLSLLGRHGFGARRLQELLALRHDDTHQGARTVEIESCVVGEHLRCPAGAGGESWTRIQRLEVRDADTFILLHFSNEESLDVTPHHLFTLGDGSPMRAERLRLRDVFVGRFGHITLKRIEAVVEDARIVMVICEPPHQFFAGRHAASVLTRNYTFSS
jgi:hypothetical protein